MNTPRTENKTIGILGGMGPLATVDMFLKIVNLCDCQTDQAHPRVLIDSNTNAPDRSPAILRGGPSPLTDMVRSALTLERGGADVLIMACNTAHYFLPRLRALTDTAILNMLEITGESCADRFPGKRAAVLATRGTLATGLYSQALERTEVDFIIPDEAEQDVLMHLIYDVVKASRPIESERETWARLLEGLRKKGADYFILGCTELPIVAATLDAEGPFVDPTEELAKEAIRYCGYEVKE